MDRRDFLKTGCIAGGAALTCSLFDLAMPFDADAFDTGGGIGIEEGLSILDGGKEKNVNPVVRPEIMNNPRAVFLVETHVDARPDARGFYSDARTQLEESGRRTASLVFVRGAKRGGSTLVAPNFTSVQESVKSPVTGVITSPDFIAGFAEGLRDLGTVNIIATERGGSISSRRATGVYDVFDRHGIPLIEAQYQRFGDYSKRELNWHRIPGKPVVWNRMPTCRPVGDPDCFYINMPKLKCHNLGLTTLSIKNIQGVVPSGYGHYCTQWPVLRFESERTLGVDLDRVFLSDYYERVEAAFLRHRAEGYKYWDHEGAYAAYERKGGWNAFRKIMDDQARVREFMSDIPPALMYDELWCQRAIDSAFAVHPDINIVEGIIGRDGNGFGVGTDRLANYIVVGLSKLEVDAVASYIMGQNPLELYYTRIGKERGLGENDPEKIGIFRFTNDGGIEPVKSLANIRRTPLGVSLHNWKNRDEKLFW